jgi:hypothetical protein
VSVDTRGRPRVVHGKGHRREARSESRESLVEGAPRHEKKDTAELMRPCAGMLQWIPPMRNATWSSVLKLRLGAQTARQLRGLSKRESAPLVPAARLLQILHKGEHPARSRRLITRSLARKALPVRTEPPSKSAGRGVGSWACPLSTADAKDPARLYTECLRHFLWLTVALVVAHSPTSQKMQALQNWLPSARTRGQPSGPPPRMEKASKRGVLPKECSAPQLSA